MSGTTPGAADAARPEEQLPAAGGPLTGERTPDAPRSNVFVKELLRGSAVTTLLAIVLAMIVGGVLIAATNETVQAAAGYFFARPGDTFVAIWNAVYNGYEPPSRRPSGGPSSICPSPST